MGDFTLAEITLLPVVGNNLFTKLGTHFSILMYPHCFLFKISRRGWRFSQRNLLKPSFNQDVKVFFGAGYEEFEFPAHTKNQSLRESNRTLQRLSSNFNSSSVFLSSCGVPSVKNMQQLRQSIEIKVGNVGTMYVSVLEADRRHTPKYFLLPPK